MTAFRFSLAAAFIAAAILLCVPAAAPAQCDSELCPAEVLHYALRWGVFPVGTATLATTPRDGDCLHHVTARSNALVDLVAKVRDEIVARAECERGMALHYAKSLQEGSYRSRYHVRFRQGIAVRTDELTGDASSRNVGGVVDPVTALFLFRAAQYPQEGHVVSRVVSDGTVLVHAWSKFVRRERLHVGERFVETQLFDVSMSGVDGFFRLADGALMRIWVTDDDLRIPLKIQARVVIAGFEGEFTGVLSAAERDGRVVLDF